MSFDFFFKIGQSNFYSFVFDLRVSNFSLSLFELNEFDRDYFDRKWRHTERNDLLLENILFKMIEQIVKLSAAFKESSCPFGSFKESRGL